MDKAETAAIAWLEKQHAAIMDNEKVALALMQAGDVSGYRKNMRAKAEALANLAEGAETILAPLPESARKQMESGLTKFSASAMTAIELDSVFYMSALLYPDDHNKGEPDNLELFINDLKNQWS